MSPAAAADFQSPFTVKPSSSANPTSSNPLNCSNDSLQDQSRSISSNSSSSLLDANSFGFGNGIGVGNGNGFVSHNGSRVESGRRPRLAKVRKHAGRLGTSGGGTETGLGINPFQSVGENSSSTNNLSFNSSLSSNGVSGEASVLNEFHFVNNENVGFVFGANLNTVGAGLNLEKKDCSECSEKSGLGDDLCLNLNLKKEEFGQTLKKSSSNQRFGFNQNDLGSRSNFIKGEFNRNFGDSGLDSVFGDSWCSPSNLNPHGSDLIENNGKIVSDDDQVRRKVESKIRSPKVKASEARLDSNGGFYCNEDHGDGVFIFIGGKKKSSCSTNEAKLDTRSFGSDNNVGKTEKGNVKSKTNNVSKIDSSKNMGGVSTKSPSYQLSDEMLKLNINEYENDYSTDKKYDSNKNSCTSADTTFVFSSSIKPSGSSDGSLGPRESGSTAVFYRMGSENFENHDSDKNNQSFRNQSGFTKGSKITAGLQTNVDVEGASLPSGGFNSKQNDYGSKTLSAVEVQNDESSTTNTHHGFGVSFTEFVTPNWDPSCFKLSLCPELNKKLESSVTCKSIRDKRSKKTRGKSKQPSLKQGLNQVRIAKQSKSQVNPSTPDCYSPMDFSPYMETPLNDSQETCVTSKEPFYSDNSFAPFTAHYSGTVDLKDESFATIKKDFGTAVQNFSESNKESPLKEFVFGSETAYPSFEQGKVYSGSGKAIASKEHADGINTKSHKSEQFCSALGVDDQKYFTFSSLSTADRGSTLRKCKLRKKGKKKVGNYLFISPSPNNKVKQVSVSSTAAILETCEMWRLRGNQAYKNSNLTKAEDFYTQGINSVPSSGIVGCCIKPLVLCYSNRAATRISLGRMREALEDCMMAATVDPNFHKVYIRAANCHLVLGETENALEYYNKLLNSGADVCLDRRITIEAADGLQKAQKVAKCINYSAKLLEQKTSEAASSALEIINEALLISSCSEKLLEMKVEALYLFQKYEEAIQLCEQTRCVAEKNFPSSVTDDCSVNTNASGSRNYSLARLWRRRIVSKSYFCMGKLEVALDLLQKLEEVGSISDKYGSEILESLVSLATTICELLRLKSAGNEAVKSGRYTEAVEHYTVALSSNVESRPFAAICFCNRAAALQALWQIPDAIADCSLAMALNENYTKAISRRAALHEIIRDYAHAATDLQRLVSILENQSTEKTKQSGSPSRSTGSKELRQARRRMSLIDEAVKGGDPLDFYLILGVKASDTTADIKKAYRKAALKHHPDKAGQFLVRTESADEGRLWKEIAHEVHKDADRLFKMIGEAYAVLSDTTKRSEYDLEEEIRKAAKESRRSSDAYHDSFRRSANRQSWQDTWTTYGYGNSHSRW